MIPAPEQESRRNYFLPLLLPACLLPLLLPLPALALSGADIITTVATEAGTSLVDGSGDFQTGLSASFLLVLFSEIGDKTFFIAALLAARRPLLEVFAGTFGALGVMTVISVLLGQAFHVLDELIPVRLGDSVLPLDDAAAAVLLVYFGLTTLRDATQMEDSGESEEEQEAAEVVAQLAPGMMGVKSDSTAQGTDTSAGATSAEATSSSGRGEGVSLPMMASVFALVFLAEWGDKSFFSTIALAAASSPTGVIAGSVAAHGLATLIAVLGGSILASVISEKAVAYVGGTLFLVFAGATVFQIIDKIAG